MKYEITQAELITQPYSLNDEQLVLGLLKEKGAPVNGIIYFEVQPGYNIQRYDDPIKRSIIFEFELNPPK